MALAAPSVSSPSTTSDDLILPVPDPIKFLVRTDKDHLLEYTTDSKIKRLVKNIGDTPGSSIALVDNLIYVVGGRVNDCSSTRVVFYKLTTTQPLISTPLVGNVGPSLNSPKFIPTLVVTGKKLFAFSWRFQLLRPFSSLSLLHDPSSPSCAPESFPLCEALDTSSPLNKWCSINSFPTLPCPSTKGLFAYTLCSYAAQLNKNTLFLSFGRSCDTVGVYSMCYDHSTDLWTDVQPTPLPFVGEAKFIDDTCFGFPSGLDRHDCDYVACYKFTVDWQQTKSFTFVTLATYSLLSNSTLTSYPEFFSFEPLSSHALTTIRVKRQGYRSSREVYSLELEVLELLPLAVEKKQLQGMEEIIDVHSSHVRSTTTYTMYRRLRAIVGAYW